MDRRDFVRASTAAFTALSYSRVLGANERVSLGFIGLGNRGDQVLTAFLEHGDSRIDALCDLRRDYMDHAKGRAEKRGERKMYADYRKLLESAVDAVVIATPDHWHALQTIHACQAGKDVYVEKPLSLTVVEGRRMVRAARKYGRVAQVGTQRRSLPWAKRLSAIARADGIGHITVADTYEIGNEWPQGIGNPPDSPPPADVDYDLWLGPAPAAAHNVNRTFYKFRWFRDYSGGQVTNMGVHLMDVVHWALGRDAPLEVAAMGGRFAIDDNREIPDTAKILFAYPGGTLAAFNQYNASGYEQPARPQIELRGTKGTMLIRGRGFEIVPDSINPHGRYARTPLDRAEERAQRADAKPLIEPLQVEGPGGTELHTRNFLDCVKSRERCNADIEIGHRSTCAPLIGNIALRTGKRLTWDREAERFTNDSEANGLLHYEYRKPWELPEI